MIAPRLMVLEDDADLRTVLRDCFREEGFDVEVMATAHEFLARVPAHPPDAMVVDIGLPDADGRDVCQALRAQGIRTPVLFLTAKDALVDRLAGFHAGGDDYLTKPFSFDELIARLYVLVRRGGADIAAQIGPLRLDPAAHAAIVGDTRVALTPTEFRVLAALCGRPGEVVRRRELVRVAWAHGSLVNENTLDSYIARLRRKLSGLRDAPAIVNVRGIGYTIE